MHEQNNKLDRRDFMKKGAQATAAAVLGTSTVRGAGPDDTKITFTDVLPARVLGKTGVKLPMLGSVESLNVSVATGVVLYEVVRQRLLQGS